MTAPTTASPFWRSPGLRDDPEKIVHTGIHPTAFEYGSFDDLMLSFARLKDLVELQVDNFGNWDASAEWMRKSEDFRQNPVGAFFDPDRVLAAHKAGATFEQLQKDTYGRNIPLRNRQTSMSLRPGDFLTRVARSARSASEIPLKPICDQGREVVRGYLLHVDKL